MKAGNVLLQHRTPDGKLVDETRSNNIVVTFGRRMCRDMLVDIAGSYTAPEALMGAAPTHMGLSLGYEDSGPAEKDIYSYWYNGITRRYAEASKAVFQLFVSTTQANGYTINRVNLISSLWAPYTTDAAGFLYASFPSYPSPYPTLFAFAYVPEFTKAGTFSTTVTWEFPILSG